MARKGRVRDKLVESRIKINQSNKNGVANTSSLGKRSLVIGHIDPKPVILTGHFDFICQFDQTSVTSIQYRVSTKTGYNDPISVISTQYRPILQRNGNFGPTSAIFASATLTSHRVLSTATVIFAEALAISDDKSAIWLKKALTVKACKGKSSVAGVIQGQGVAVGPICVGRKSTDTERVLNENPNRSETQFENRNEYQKPANDEYIDGNYLLQNSKQVKKVRFRSKIQSNSYHPKHILIFSFSVEAKNQFQR